MASAKYSTISAVLRASRRLHEQTALVDNNNPYVVGLTYYELEETVRIAARALMALGINKGDRVAIWTPNSWQWIVTSLAVYRAGGVLVPINERLKEKEALQIVALTEAKILFCFKELLDLRYLLMSKKSPLPTTLKEIVHLDEELEDGQSHNRRRRERADKTKSLDTNSAIDFGDFLARSSVTTAPELSKRSAEVGGNDICHIIFTSGTSGTSKGAMLRHKGVCASYQSFVEKVGLESDTYLITSPFSHTLGLHAGIVACLASRSTMLPMARFDPEAALKIIDLHKATVLAGPPAMFLKLLRHEGVSRESLSSVRLAITGAAPIAGELIHNLHKLGIEQVVTGYGLTEASGVVALNKFKSAKKRATPNASKQQGDEGGAQESHEGGAEQGDEGGAQESHEGGAQESHEGGAEQGDEGGAQLGSEAWKPNSIGQAIDGVEIRVDGEILVRGQNVMQGYLGDPNPANINAEGFLHTGDIGEIDQDGNITIVGRKEDMFIAGGFNVYPAEVEAMILKNPSVSQVAVVGVPDELLGEVGFAFVVCTVGAPTTISDLRAWCKDEMANYKIPRHFAFVDSLPTNPNGKPDKTHLRHQAQELTRDQAERG